MPENKQGCFITLEGGEGAGKSTLMKSLAAYLSGHYSVLTTREPGGTPLGEQIRQLLLNTSHPLAPKTELLLFLAARAQHIQEVIAPALAEGKAVICDRFNDSTIAYQGYARNLGVENVQKLCEFVCENVTPSLTFLLDVDPAKGLNRTRQAHKESASQGNLDRIEAEALSFHERVQEGLHRLAHSNPQRIFVLDANRSPEQVFEQAKSHLQKCLNIS